MIERLRVRIPAGAAGTFCSPDLTLFANSYPVFVRPRVTAVARKRLRSLCQKCRWQVTPKHTYTLDPSKSEWADYDAVIVREPITRKSSGNTRSQSSQLDEPLWTDPGLKGGIRVRELIST